MNLDVETVRRRINAQVVSLAEEVGATNVEIDNDALIPETGLLDSPRIVGLVLWIEEEFDLSIPDEDITMTNLGSINRIASYVLMSTNDRG